MAYGICERERKEGEKLQKFRLVSFCLEAKNTAILSRDVDGNSFLIRATTKLVENHVLLRLTISLAYL